MPGIILNLHKWSTPELESAQRYFKSVLRNNAIALLGSVALCAGSNAAYNRIQQDYLELQMLHGRERAEIIESRDYYQATQTQANYFMNSFFGGLFALPGIMVGATRGSECKSLLEQRLKEEK